MSSDIKQKREDLQNFVGEKPKIEIDDFINYGKTQKRSEILACRPKTLEEIQAVVRGCHQHGIRVRAAGATHSWSPLFSDEGQLVLYTSDIKRHDGPQIELIQDPNDDSVKFVTVMTNITTGDLMEFQISHGVCLQSNVVLRVVTMGGVVSAACHGVGKDVKTISDNVTSMRIIDSEGELRTYSVKDDGIELMKAVQCNLGLFGIMYDITLDVSNMIIAETNTIIKPVSQVFYNKECLKEIMENWSVEIFWFPFNSMNTQEITESIFEREIDWGEWEPKDDEVWIRAINKPESVGEVKPPKSYRLQGMNEFLQITSGKLAADWTKTFPAFTASFCHTQWKFIKNQLEDEPRIFQQLPHAVHFRDHIEQLTVQDMEWAIDFDDDCTNVMKAAQHVIDTAKILATKKKFPLNLALEMRVISHSDIYLAPAIAGNPKHGGSGKTLYIEVLSIAGTKDWDEFCEEISKVWSNLPGAKPHWCKEWSNLSGIDNFIKKAYKTQFPKFLDELQKTKADVDGIFFNDRLESLMFPKGHPGWKKLKDKHQKNAKGNYTSKDEEPKKSKTCQIL